ncbi:hypothetical protein BD414DRAFT_467807 [Trametes punicea]|nr:hypothetical protein BD414DRAFT_467807 [Trametes punicea]
MTRVPPWPSNESNPGRFVELTGPWVPSPSVRVADVPRANEEAQSSRSGSTRSTRPSSRKQRTRRQAGDDEPTAVTRERTQSWLSCLHPKRLLSGTRSSRRASEHREDATAERADGRATRREVTPAEWRAYGYWARPFLRNWPMIVHNATPPVNPRELSPAEVDAMLASLREPGGATFPENWVPRVRHPSLPPRPDLWPTPRQTPEPLPGEVQLNPWLVHRSTGPPHLHFDLRYRAADIMINEEPYDRDGFHLPGMRSHFCCDGPNGSQPATYPGLPRLRICALADDPQPVFWWPFTVIPHHEFLPVLMADVFDALIANFEERITSEEIRLLSEERRLMVYRAYLRRTNLVIGGVQCPKDDGLRRVDYLGDNVCFRGLEPAPDGQGFILFMGPPP